MNDLKILTYSDLPDIDKSLVDKLEIYLGFNEVMSSSEFHDLIFKKFPTKMPLRIILGVFITQLIGNYTCVASRSGVNPALIEALRLKQKPNPDLLDRMLTVGTDCELDPRGLLRLYVKHKYIKK